jgi:thiazole/oxazole-forming peptide maturase SagD family component
MKLNAWVGKGSPIRELVKLQRRPTDFRFHVWGTRISQNLESRLPETADRFVGCGISEEDEKAIASACGEALERYIFALSSDFVEDLPILEADDSISADFVFNLPFLLPKAISRNAWCEQAVKSARRVLPAIKITNDGQQKETELPVEFLTPDASVNLFQTTNGMACGTSLEDAIDRGLREVIERDALMLVWLYKTGGIFLNPETVLPRDYLEQIQRMEYRGIKTIIRDISTDFGYRVVLAIVGHFPQNGAPIFAFGAGAAIDILDAAKHAFREACLGWKGVSWRVGLNARRASFSEGEDALPRSFAEHSELYFEPEMVSEVSFLFEQNSQAINSQFPMASSQLLKDIYVLNLTTPDVREMGAYVVKVILPGLVPFYFADLGSDQLAASRLPTKLGGAMVTCDRNLNTLPHPWP